MIDDVKQALETKIDSFAQNYYITKGMNAYGRRDKSMPKLLAASYLERYAIALHNTRFDNTVDMNELNAAREDLKATTVTLSTFRFNRAFYATHFADLPSDERTDSIEKMLALYAEKPFGLIGKTACGAFATFILMQLCSEDEIAALTPSITQAYSITRDYHKIVTDDVNLAIIALLSTYTEPCATAQRSEMIYQLLTPHLKHWSSADQLLLASQLLAVSDEDDTIVTERMTQIVLSIKPFVKYPRFVQPAIARLPSCEYSPEEIGELLTFGERRLATKKGVAGWTVGKDIRYALSAYLLDMVLRPKDVISDYLDTLLLLKILMNIQEQAATSAV